MSEYTIKAGMIARYKVRCKSLDCIIESDIATPSRKEAADYARKNGWRHIRGAWYCAKCAAERRVEPRP